MSIFSLIKPSVVLMWCMGNHCLITSTQLFNIGVVSSKWKIVIAFILLSVITNLAKTFQSNIERTARKVNTLQLCRSSTIFTCLTVSEGRRHDCWPKVNPLIRPLVASYSSGHKSCLLHVSGWEMFSGYFGFLPGECKDVHTGRLSIYTV